MLVTKTMKELNGANPTKVSSETVGLSEGHIVLPLLISHSFRVISVIKLSRYLLRSPGQCDGPIMYDCTSLTPARFTIKCICSDKYFLFYREKQLWKMARHCTLQLEMIMSMPRNQSSRPPTSMWTNTDNLM